MDHVAEGQRQNDFRFGNLAEGDEVVGISDFNNDGTDDLIIRSAGTDSLTAWLVKDGTVTGSLAIK